ncbi:HpcH/HpaI aldolase/citrate lyase family protein [Deinococcus roseus]|uniref:Citrate lyase subunit beta n=1 Tax=Deinococcus roseus TaxID=392414 RepID=A0ABQ2D015_9DEIO|nr:CoA ester lyase [Deinococcus roseus]GGJ37609.1 citrate lyase subunit beta [Deinococcus roseus]
MPIYKRRRSALFLPASNTRAIEKARTLQADVVILDLEDAVSPEQKALARNQAASAIREGFPMEVAVRINPIHTVWGEADLALMEDIKPELLVLPKVESTADLPEVGLPLWAMIETPLGVVNSREIAEHGDVEALVMGTTDLVKTLQARPMPSRDNLLYALSQVVLHARAYGKYALDGVHLDFRNMETLKEVCLQGKALGFDGKTLIHPLQIEMTNRIFSPSPEEIEWARKVIAAWQNKDADQGVTVLDGQLIEELHAIEAERILELTSLE